MLKSTLDEKEEIKNFRAHMAKNCPGLLGGGGEETDDEALVPDFHVLVICGWGLAFLPRLLIIPGQVPYFLRLHSTFW